MIRLLLWVLFVIGFLFGAIAMKRTSFVITLAMLAMLVTASAVQAAPPSTEFSGTWIGYDTPRDLGGDGSTEHLVVNGGDNARIDYQDEFGQACSDANADDFWLSTDLRGTVDGDVMTGFFKSAKCGHMALTDWKGLPMVWTFDPGATDDPADDTLFDGVVTWSRV
jgi:hypothetical protein